MKVLLLPLLAFLAIGGAGAAKELEEVQGGYSVEPLRKPIFDTAEVLVDAAAFNNWLNENHSTLTPETMKGPREHLYYLIGSRVADLYARNGQVFPQDDDLILASLFSWSERLGVFGGHLVYNVLRQDGSPPMEPLMPTPKGVELGLSGDMLVLRAPSEHWSVSFPYYFMVWNMAEFDTNQGMRTQVIALSTGAARHKGQPGHSQATLMFIFAPAAELAKFESYWKQMFNIDQDAKARQLPVSGRTSRQRVDTSLNMYTEFTSWQTEYGSLGVAYMGINGTFQSNREHFFDFLRAIVVD